GFRADAGNRGELIGCRRVQVDGCGSGRSRFWGARPGLRMRHAGTQRHGCDHSHQETGHRIVLLVASLCGCKGPRQGIEIRARGSDARSGNVPAGDEESQGNSFAWFVEATLLRDVHDRAGVTDKVLHDAVLATQEATTAVIVW